jgi:hypothetical protein
MNEIWTGTNMTRSNGRCRRGKRLRMSDPHGHRTITTLLIGLSIAGLMVLNRRQAGAHHRQRQGLAMPAQLSEPAFSCPGTE